MVLTLLGFSQYLTIVGLFATAGMFYLTSMNDLLPATRCESPPPCGEVSLMILLVLRPLKRALLLFCLPVEIVISTVYVGPPI